MKFVKVKLMKLGRNRILSQEQPDYGEVALADKEEGRCLALPRRQTCGRNCSEFDRIDRWI